MSTDHTVPAARVEPSSATARESMAHRYWRVLAQFVDLLVLARIPILMVLAGFVLASYVAQIRELIDISLHQLIWAGTTFVFTGLLAVLVWYSARTLYSFHWPHWQGSPAMQRWLGKHLPRLLGASGPLIMAGAYAQADVPASGAGSQHFWVLAYLAMALLLWALFTWRREIVNALGARLASSMLSMDDAPPVAFHRHWSGLRRDARAFHYAGLLALPMSWVVGLYFPSTIDALGPLALILGAAAFTVWASTYPVYLAARARFPLITALLLWAVLMTWLGGNDNHAVRLSAAHQSDQNPPADLHYAPDGRPSLDVHMQAWWRERAQDCGQQVWLVSSEGGGIRAAMWTVLVLAELERGSGGKLWHCTLAASGVSGGSLGLALFASAYRDSGSRYGDEQHHALVGMLETDYLAPVLGAMFGVDALQRFLPWRQFTDRGQALENAWVQAYARSIGGDSLKGPLADTAYALDAQRNPLPALLLNTTIVDSGLRLIQHPFSSLSGPHLSDAFPGVVDGAQWLPRQLPLFSAAHNSARFTMVSPAGSVRRRSGNGEVQTLGQVVDGGYFENSATTTVQALIQGMQSIAPESAIRVIHISNDPAVPPFAPGALDVCPLPTALQQALVRSPDAPEVTVYGEVRAPLNAILATRDARGEYARQALLDRIIHSDGARLWHYRLCQGQRVLPLGWTLSAQSHEEMRRQLAGNGNNAAADLRTSSQQIIQMLARPAAAEPIDFDPPNRL